MFNAEATALSSVILAVLSSATIGSQTAKWYGRSPVLGAILGGLLPIIGVGILFWMGHKTRREDAVLQ
jgi:uncharacterized membrane-anchored protein YitT (DUF2179 family)